MDEQNSDMKKLELPRYRCHKEVCALKIKAVVHQDGPGDTLDNPGILIPEDERYAHIRVDAAYMRKHDPQEGGYWVRYADGYESFSPAEAFESGYTQVE